MNHTESEKLSIESRMVEFWRTNRMLQLSQISSNYATTYDRIEAALEYWKSKPLYSCKNNSVTSSTPCYDSIKPHWDMAVKMALRRVERED